MEDEKEVVFSVEEKNISFLDKANVAGQDLIDKIIGYTMSFKEKLEEPKKSWIIILGIFAIFFEKCKEIYIFLRTKYIVFYEKTKPKMVELFEKTKSKFSKKVEESSPQEEETPAK